MKYFLCECTVTVASEKSRIRLITQASDRADAFEKFTAHLGHGSHITLFVTEVKII